MFRQLTSSRRARSLSTALFLIGLAYAALSGSWWPNMILIIGIPVTLKQFLMGRAHDVLLSIVVFGGVFVSYQYDINWQMLLPVIFVIAAIYVLFKEFSISSNPTTAEEEEDLNHEIEEEEK